MSPDGHLFFAGSLTRPACRELSRARGGAVTAHRRAIFPPPEGAVAFLTWLLAQAELTLANYRLPPLIRRLPACLRSVRACSVTEARQKLERHPELLGQALDAVLLGVTDFFRDAAVFAQLDETVLPELLQKPADRIRVWSAACSDGPELYSVAMLLAEAGNLARAELLGSDCRPTAIMRAAAGVFAAEAVRPVLDRVSRTRPHFRPVGHQRVQASEELRGATRWRIADLLRGPLPGPWDLILWRNMAIYLAPEAADAAWHRLVRELRPGGYLITGKADHPPRELDLIRVGKSIYRRRMEGRDES